MARTAGFLSLLPLLLSCSIGPDSAGIALEGSLDAISVPSALAVRATIPRASTGLEPVRIQVLDESLTDLPMAYGGGARLAESLLSLTLRYRIRLEGAGAAEHSCRKDAQLPIDETRPLATARRKEALLQAMATACARRMLDRAVRLLQRAGDNDNNKATSAP